MKRNSWKRMWPIFLCIGLLLTACGGSSGNDKGLLGYALDVKSDMAGPKGLEYRMTSEQVAQARNLTDAKVNEQDQIIHPMSLEGLSDEVQEIFIFQDNELCSVLYAVPVKSDSFDAVQQDLLKQAEEMLPAEWKLGEDGSEQIIWQDPQNNQVQLQFMKEKEMVFLKMSMAHPSRTSLEPK